MEKVNNDLSEGSYYLPHHQVYKPETLKIPRHILTESYERTVIVGYADASEAAFGAVVYMKTIMEDGTAVNKLIANRLKPAFIIPPECSSIPPAKQEASSTTECTKTLPAKASIVVPARQTTRTGRQVRPPRRYVHFQ
ncbi:hypothetical protein HNY73_011444 [Argiope bruennichi]|uniref:Uncharacterized protein n=1 Tax=Argiope bruennichi TaxID=94029 RepID=A0A8T0FAH4_ARGBR|nr:hypothetical protein HNY73_011444 [Argiope bruennichi]